MLTAMSLGLRVSTDRIMELADLPAAPTNDRVRAERVPRLEVHPCGRALLGCVPDIFGHAARVRPSLLDATNPFASTGSGLAAASPGAATGIGN